MAVRKTILWLVSWYPNKYDPFDGDFIQRQAKAAALYDDVHVIFVKQDTQQKSIEKITTNVDNLTEQIIYLPKQKSFLGKWKNYQQWKEVYKSEVRLLIETSQPDLVHVHVPWKAGLVALWIKRRFTIPFAVTEHWGIYNTSVEDNIYRKPLAVRYLLRRIYSKAKTFISVSRFLGEGVNHSLVKKEFIVVSNVVDTALFFLSDKKTERFTFLHVSNMVPLKNVEGIITAFHQFLNSSESNARLVLIGNRDDQYERLANQLGLLNKSVFFKGEIPYKKVAEEMQQSHVFVLNSRMENSPCVIGEALCCGLPVIATNVGGIPELIDPACGLLIPSGNTIALSDAMLKAFTDYHLFKKDVIARSAQAKFSYATIGLQLHDLY